MCLKGFFLTPFSLHLQGFSMSKNKLVFTQFSSLKYSGIYETDSVHLFVLRIRQMEQLSSDAEETRCYFHFCLSEYTVFCVQRVIWS